MWNNLSFMLNEQRLFKHPNIKRTRITHREIYLEQDHNGSFLFIQNKKGLTALPVFPTE